MTSKNTPIKTDLFGERLIEIKEKYNLFRNIITKTACVMYISAAGLTILGLNHGCQEELIGSPAALEHLVDSEISEKTFSNIKQETSHSNIVLGAGMLLFGGILLQSYSAHSINNKKRQAILNCIHETYSGGRYERH
jgi:hypothetical protein